MVKGLALVAGTIAYLLAISGIGFLISAHWFSEEWKSRLAQPIFKRIIAISRFVSVLLGATISLGKLDDAFSFSCVVAGAAGYLAWEIAGIWADSWGKAEAMRILVLKKTLLRLEALQFGLDRFVKTKRENIAASLRDSSVSPTIGTVRTAIDPARHINELLKSLAHYFVPDQESMNDFEQRFRICIYIEREDHLVEAGSFDSNQQTTASTKSYQMNEYKHKFRLDNTEDPAMVVRAIRSKTLTIVSDCTSVDGFYFREEQRTYLKSMVIQPFEIGLDPKRPLHAALVVDTNFCGYFKEEDRYTLSKCLSGFANRIDLEMIYDKMIQSPNSRLARDSHL